MSDVSVELGLNAQELYSELQAVTAKFVTFASQTSSAGEKAGSGFLSGLKSKIESAGGFLHGAGAQVLGGLGIGFSIGAVVSEIKSITEDTIAYGAKIEDFSRRFGVSTEILQKFGNVAEKNGSSVDGIAKAFQRLDIARAKALTGGPDNAFAKIFEHAGVSFEELNGPLDNLALKIGAAHLNAADFLKVFSKGGADVRVTLEGLADGTFKFGGAISDVNIKKLKEAEDALKTLSQEVTILAGSALPGVFKLAELSAEGFISKLEIAGIHMAALAKFSANIVVNPAAAFEALKEGAVETQAARKRSDKFSQEIKDRLDHPDTQKFHGPNLPTPDDESGETDDQGRPIGKGSAKSTASNIERLKDENAKEEEALRLGRLDTEARINDLIAKRKGLQDELAAVAKRAGKEEGPEEELQRLQTKHDILEIDKQIAEEQKKREAEKDRADKDHARETERLDKEHKRDAERDARSDVRKEQRESEGAQVSLQDLAEHGTLIGGPGGQARQALEEQRLARTLALNGDLEGSRIHQSRANEIKDSIGVLKDSEKSAAYQEALEKSAVLNKIEKNTQGLGVNK